MPRAFNSSEETAIRLALLTQGKQLFEKRSVFKTSIDELTTVAGISKGSFYKFFDSKEQLFFELLEQAQNEIRAPLIDTESGAKTESELRKAIKRSIEAIQGEPLLQVVSQKQELMKLARKIPPQTLMEHQKSDKEFVHRLIACWNQKPVPPSSDQVSSHFAMLLMIQFNETLLGDRLYPHAEEMIIDSFCRCLFD